MPAMEDKGCLFRSHPGGNLCATGFSSRTQTGLLGEHGQDPSGKSQFWRFCILTILHRVEGRPEVPYAGAFSDVPEGEWYTEGVEWAAFHGIVLGYGNGHCGPDDFVTREQLSAILIRYAEYKG